MTDPITTIIFDFGNVLLGWDARKLYNRLLPDPETVDRFLKQISFADWNAKQDAGRPFRDGVAELSSQFPQHAELIQAYDTYWEESLTGTIDGTIEIVQELKEAGWPLYLLSNFSVEKFELIRDRHTYLDLFNDIIISGEYGIVKPDPAIFHIALERMNKKASECLFIDDSQANINTASSLGLQTIHFHSPAQLRTELIKYSIKGLKSS